MMPGRIGNLPIAAENPLGLSWHDSAWIPMLSPANIMDYFSERSNPFFDRTCNNEVVKMQRLSMDQLQSMTGLEYMLLHVQDPILYVIRKQHRHSPNHVIPLADYYIIAGIVYQAPDLASVLNSRLRQRVDMLLAELVRQFPLPVAPAAHNQEPVDPSSSDMTNGAIQGHEIKTEIKQENMKPPPEKKPRDRQSANSGGKPLGLSWHDSAWIPMLSPANIMDYFSERSNPFFDRTCNNEVYDWLEYMLLHVQDPILYVIRKQHRHSPNHVIPLADYYIIAGIVYQAPDLASVLNSRLKQCLIQGTILVKGTGGISRQTKLEPSTVFQRQRVDMLLAELVRQFPLPVAPAAHNQEPVDPSSSDMTNGAIQGHEIKTEIKQENMKPPPEKKPRGTMNDNQYGPYADLVKQSIGLEYELRLERELRLLNITFSDENILRSRGYDKTPDFKLDVPIAVDGFIVNWVESKALFGDEENHSGYLKDQLMAYWNRFGPGLLIYWFGYLETLDSTPEVNKMFILRTSFPKKESITQYKMDLDLLKTQTNKTAVKGADNEEKVVYNLIEEAGNKGIWIRDIRVRSNLANTQLTKVLKSLESKKVIKAASKKKVYMLFNLEPDRSISGGAWYQDQDFESEFVDILNRQCLRFLQQRADKIKNNPRGPIVGRTQSYATGAEVHKYITDLGISNVTLDVEDVITILNTLVYDGKAESSMYPDGSKVFRAIESLLPPQDSCKCLAACALLSTSLNSGVMLMNLTRMRDFGWVDYVTPIMLKWKLYIPWGDQALYRAVEEYKFGSDAKDALFAMERYLAEAPPSPCELLNSSRHFEARDVFAEVLERPVDLDFDAWVEFQYGEGVFVDVGGARGQRTRRLLAGLRLQLVAHGAPVHADERQRHPEHLEHPGRVKLKIADFFGMWKLAFQDKIDQGNRIEELLGDLATDDPVPYRLRNSAQQAYMDEYQLYLVNITQKKDLPVPPEYLSLLWYFFKPHMFSKSTRVIPMLEQWIPGCGVWLITGQDPPDTNKKLAPGKADAPLPHMTIFTEFGDLNLKQKITVFKKLISWPEFEQCQFRVSMENNLPKFVTAVDEDVKTSIDAHIDDVESSDSDKLTSDWLGPEGVDCFWGSNGAALKLAAYFGMLFCFNNVLFNYLSIVNIRFIFRDFHVQVHAADPMELQALLVLGGVGVVLVAVLLLMGLFSASGTSYEEAIAQQRRATTELLALAENKNKPKKNNKKAIKKLARKEKNKENNAAATGSEVDSDVPAESGVDEDIVPPVKPHVEFCPPIIVDVPRDTPPNVKIRKRGKDPKVKPILINKEDPSCISDPSTPPSPTGSVSNHFEEIHPKDEFELLQSSLAAEKPSELTTDKLLKQALAAAPPAPAPAPAPAPSPPAVKNKKKKPEPNVLSLMGKSYLAYAHNFTQAAAAARVELHTQQARLQRVLDENQALQQDQLLLQSKLGAEEAQAQRIVQMEMHIQQLSESEVTLMAQVEAQAREAYLAQQQAAMLAQQQASAVRAAAGRRRARPRRRGPARAPRRAAAAGPPRRSRRLARQHASSTRSSWATPRAPAPTRTSARTTPSCSCRTASPVTLPQQPPAGPAARQQYAQQLGDAARARADADQRAHHAELQLQDRLAGNTPAAAAGWPGSTPAVRAAAGRRRARPRRRGPARAPRRAAAAGPPRRSRRLARQHASSTRSSWATPRAPAPTRTSARTTPSCSCRTASPVTLPQQPPAGPAARQQYAQQLGDAARARADADQRAHHAELQLQDRLAGNTPAAAAGWPGSTPASAELAKVESVVESLRNALATEQRANSEQKETLARLQEQLSQYQDKNNEAISKAQEAQYAEVANVLRLACPAAAPAAAAGRAWLLQFADNLKKEVSAAAPAPEPAPAPAPVPAAAPAADARLAELSAQNDQLQAHVDKYKRIIDETMQKKIDTLQAELQQKQAANHNHSFADSERLAEERLLTDMSEKYKVDVCNGPLQVGLEEK
ncbi:hypothetical protein MSG28_006888 [Choristoneura fumiferana]|uniref:Uncharacterized protein n=1 Tax=Choristoneura fumiferana TaxID=7141 RepID=A0ACC0JLJ4_CHOFU|nr:hypothetical protein MSG28_006888 [Choristoneura fumiferana]